MRRKANTDHREPNHHVGAQLAGWTAAIADQVKNPVAGISAAAGIIEKQMAAFRSNTSWDPAIVEEAVRLMQQRLSRFDNYLSELSGFTRPVVLQSLEIPIIQEWPLYYQYIVRRLHSDVHMSLMCDDGVQTVYADPDKLRGMLLAVMLNSAEAVGPFKTAEISITVSHHCDADTPMAGEVISIRDVGPGFSHESLRQGLIPFFTTKEAGAGLGLAMIEKYARAHGGWVRIGNWQGEQGDGSAHGAEVKIFLPWRVEE